MSRFITSLILLASTSASATDYIIRIETTGYIDAEINPDSPEPEERSLRTIETLCRIGKPFRARMTVGNETTTLTGVLKESERPESDFRVDMKHSHVVDTGTTVPVAPGVEVKVPNRTSVDTTIVLVEGEPLELGGIISSTTDATESDPSPLTRKTKHYCTITVEEYDPTADEH